MGVGMHGRRHAWACIAMHEHACDARACALDGIVNAGTHIVIKNNDRDEFNVEEVAMQKASSTPRIHTWTHVHIVTRTQCTYTHMHRWRCRASSTLTATLEPSSDSAPTSRKATRR